MRYFLFYTKSKTPKNEDEWVKRRLISEIFNLQKSSHKVSFTIPADDLDPLKKIHFNQTYIIQTEVNQTKTLSYFKLKAFEIDASSSELKIEFSIELI